MSHRKKLDLAVIIGIEVLTTVASLYFGFDFLVSTLCYLGLPSLYLAFRLRTRTQWRRITAMAIIFGVWYGFLFAYLADWNKTWAWPEASLPLGYWFSIVNPVEWLWVFLWVTFIVLFYEHFLERDTKQNVSRRYIWVALSALLFTVAIFSFTSWRPTALDWPYAYAVLAFLAVIPTILLVVTRPHILPKLFLPGLFFIPMHLSHEVTSLMLNQWYFPGQYFAIIPLPGSSGVPVEEFIIWIVLGSTLVVSYYELCIDDGK